MKLQAEVSGGLVKSHVAGNECFDVEPAGGGQMQSIGRAQCLTG